MTRSDSVSRSPTAAPTSTAALATASGPPTTWCPCATPPAPSAAPASQAATHRPSRCSPPAAPTHPTSSSLPTASRCQRHRHPTATASASPTRRVRTSLAAIAIAGVFLAPAIVVAAPTTPPALRLTLAPAFALVQPDQHDLTFILVHSGRQAVHLSLTLDNSRSNVYETVPVAPFGQVLLLRGQVRTLSLAWGSHPWFGPSTVNAGGMSSTTWFIPWHVALGLLGLLCGIALSLSIRHSRPKEVTS